MLVTGLCPSEVPLVCPPGLTCRPVPPAGVDRRLLREAAGRAQPAAAGDGGVPLVPVPPHRQHHLPGLGLEHFSGERHWGGGVSQLGTVC